MLFQAQIGLRVVRRSTTASLMRRLRRGVRRVRGARLQLEEAVSRRHPHDPLVAWRDQMILVLDDLVSLTASRTAELQDDVLSHGRITITSIEEAESLLDINNNLNPEDSLIHRIRVAPRLYTPFRQELKTFCREIGVREISPDEVH